MEEYNQGYLKAKAQQAAQHKITGTKDTAHALRLPPGQILTEGFPILDLGIRPSRNQYPDWKVEIRGLVNTKKTFSLADLWALPKAERTLDFHCVTRWSRYDINWGGVLLKDLLQFVQPKNEAKHIIFYSYDKYTTNAPLVELLDDRVLVAYELEGKEISPEHGGPVRIINPNLYGWKSAKFLTVVELRAEDEPGFWEVRGYNNHGDPWLEERYS